MYTETNRVTGLSGIDTETMVQQLMKAESVRYNKLKASNQVLTWKQEAYRSVADHLKVFQYQFLSFANPANNIRSVATFTGFDTTAIEGAYFSDAVTITTTGDSKAGEYTLEILQLAETETFVAGSQVGGSIVTTLTDPTDMVEGDTFYLALDGTRKTFTLDAADIAYIGGSLERLRETLQTKADEAFGEESPGVSKINVTTDGGTLNFVPLKGHELAIFDSFSRTTAVTAANEITALTTGDRNLIVTMGGVEKTITLKVDEDEDMEDIPYLVNKINLALKKEGLVGSVYAELDADNKVRFVPINTYEDITVANDTDNFLTELGFDVPSITLGHTSVLAAMGIKSGADNKLNLSKTLEEIFGAVIPAGDLTFVLNGATIEYNKDMALGEFMSKINNSQAGFTLSYNNLRQEFTLMAKSSGVVGKLDEMPQDLIDIFGFKRPVDYTQAEIDEGLYQVATDAVIILNGVTTTRASNNFEIDGIRMQLNKVTTEPIIINIKKNPTKAVEVIKTFIAGYNELIDKINAQEKTSRPKSGSYSYYEPLTEEEKKEMSESQINTWEAKAKEGMLYRDKILSEMTEMFRTYLYQSVVLEDGSKISLFDIGITTTNVYQDRGKLQIDEAKLTKAISDHGEDVTNFFVKASEIPYSDKGQKLTRLTEEGIGDRLDDIINDNIGSDGKIARRAGIKGTYSEGDNEIFRTMEEQGKKLTTMLTYLKKKEDYYYNMFSKMEAAIMNSNNQMAYLQSLLA